MNRITSIGRATLTSPDPERQLAHYAEILGLGVLDRTSELIVLSCPADPASVVLQRGDVAGCAALALHIDTDGDLDAFAHQLAAQGIAGDRRRDSAPDIPDLLALTGPDGIRLEVSPRPAAFSGQFGATPIGPRKLGHVAFNVSDAGKAASFFTEALGFRVSDWMGDFFAFLRCGVDHHTVNLLRGPKVKMHHIAFELTGWEHIKQTCDELGRQGVPLLWGPGRHRVGHNLFIYHRDADGQIVEFYAELDQMSDEAKGYFDPRPWHEDRPQRPKVWTPGPDISSQWGIHTPDGFRS